MISVFVVYTPGRQAILKQAIGCLLEMSLIESCQKILCVDGQTDLQLEGFETLEIPRHGKHFLIGTNVTLAVEHCRYDKILYLDPDRVLPKSYLCEIIDKIKVNCFVFPKFLYNLKKSISTEELKHLRDQSPENLQAEKGPPYLEADHRVYQTICVSNKQAVCWVCRFSQGNVSRSRWY